MRAMNARYGEQEGERRFYATAHAKHLTPTDRKPYGLERVFRRD